MNCCPGRQDPLLEVFELLVPRDTFLVQFGPKISYAERGRTSSGYL